MTKKLLGLLLVLAMLASCFAACGGDEKKEESSKTPEQSTGTENNSSETSESGEDSGESGEESGSTVTFDSLTDNREKLVYLSDSVAGDVNYDDKIYGALGVEGEDIYVPVISDDGVLKFAFNAQISELAIDGDDMLEELYGGPVGIEFNALTDGTRFNLDAAANFSGMSMDLDLKSGEDGILITSPFLFKNPVYVTGDYFESLMVGFSNAMEVTEAMSEFSASFAELGNNAVFAAYLRSKAVELIPETAVESSKVTLNDDYINGEAETDCIVLTLNGDELSVILGDLSESVGNDPAFKFATAGFFSNLYKVLSFGAMVEGSDMSFTTDTELYDAVFDFTDEMAEELAGDTDFTLVVKRYFLNGIDSRIDVELVDDGERIYFSYWDIYVDSANSYGFVIEEGNEEFLKLEGGIKGDESELSFAMKAENYEMDFDDEDGMYEEEITYETVLSFDVKRNGKDYELDVNLADEVKLDYEQTEGIFKAILFTEGEDIEIDGTIIERDDGIVVVAKFEYGANDFEVTYTRKTNVEATKFSQDLDIEIKVDIDGVIAIATVVVGMEVDTDSEEVIIDPVPGDGDFVIDDEEDIEGIYSNFTAAFLGLLTEDGGLFGGFVDAEL